MTDAELGYSDPRGATALRSALADYLGRVRGVVADPERVVVTYGYAQGLALVCRALAARGARRIGMEDPSNLDDQAIVTGAGLEPVPIGVDAEGLRVDELARSAPDAVIVTPAHQQPTGVVLSRERRLALVDWLRAQRRGRDRGRLRRRVPIRPRGGRSAPGARARARRSTRARRARRWRPRSASAGWSCPQRCSRGSLEDKLVGDRGAARIEQYAFADFVTRGELDRHLRRMRARYRKQRDAMVQALARELPEATVTGIAAGLHVTVELPEGYDAQAIRDEAARRRIVFNSMTEYREAGGGSTTLMLGYGSVSEPAIDPGVREIAEIVRAIAQRVAGAAASPAS